MSIDVRTLRTAILRRTCIALALGGLACWAAGPAVGAERSGKEIVQSLCVSCHGTGVSGAPKIGDNKAWAPRAEKGLSSLSKSAIQGIRNMPAHGGNAKLTDTEIERAITYMVNRSGGKWAEPVSRTTKEKPRTGEAIVQAQCAQCHATGKGGAPKIGDREAWLPRMQAGVDTLVRSAINGHGGMPPRGGKADLTDDELKSAIVYMFNKGTGAKS